MFAMHNNCKRMKFVDRIEESARLQKVLGADKSAFVVVYGRRRLGKSTLIKKVLSAKDVYYLADESDATHQRTLLATMIAQIIPDFDKVTYPDWETLLRALNHRCDKRFTLCLDELPNMVKVSAELPSVLQKLLDEKSLKFNLIICGSSQNLMFGLVLDATSPLYGRADAIIRLTPLKLPYLQEAIGLGDIETIEEYAVWGGVPRYWELREKYESLTEALRMEIFSVNGTLYEEPAKLFKDDIRDIVQVSTIFSYVGAGANRLSEIAGRCNTPTTNLSRPLGKLVELGYLEREIPFGENEKNSKKSLYKICDPFMSFYFRFLVPNRSYVELERLKPIEQDLEAHLNEFVSMQWEKLCRNAVTGNEVNGVLYGVARRWWGSVSRTESIELDVVAESIDKKYLLVGECKWTNSENTKRLIDELMAKAEKLPFAKGHIIVPVLFLKNTSDADNVNVLLPQDVIRLNM